MKFVKLLLAAVALLAPVVTRAQTATLRYNPPASANCGTGTTCAISLSGKPIIAGDTVIFQCNTGVGSVKSVTNTGALVTLPGTLIRNFPSGQSNSATQGYILNAAAESGTDTVTFQLPSGSFTNDQYGFCSILEYQVSGGTLQFDGDNGFNLSTGTAITIPVFTPSATDIGTSSTVGIGGSANTVSAPFIITNTLTAVWAAAAGVSTPQTTTWTSPATLTAPVAQEIFFGFNTTPCTNRTFANFNGTNGTTVTPANLFAGTSGFTGPSWSLAGGNMTFSSAFSAPLVGTLSRSCDGSSISNPGGDTTSLVYPTASGVSTHVNYGDVSAGLLSLGQVVAEVNQSFDIPATQNFPIDSFGIVAANNNGFVNAMLTGNGTNRQMALECAGHPNSGFFQQTANTTLHLQIVFNPNFIHYLNVYSGWQNPSNPGTLLYSMNCASQGPNDIASSVWLGNNQGSNVPPAGFNVFYDSLLVTYNPIPALPTCYAATAAEADVQTAITQCGSKGTIVVPASRGIVTWTTQLHVTATGPLTFQGQTFCTNGCSPGSEGVGLTFGDNGGTCTTLGTCIQLSLSGSPTINQGGCTGPTQLCEWKNFTFINGVANSNTAGSIGWFGAHGLVTMHFHHSHVISNQVGTFLAAQGSFGLIDHILYDSNGSYAFAAFGGDFNTSGYLNWNDATNPGSIEAYYIEDSQFNFGNPSSPNIGQIHDGQFGCKVVVRHNRITGPGSMSLTHGTDSGGFRSCVLVEDYNNHLTNNATLHQQTSQTRGGVVIVHDNVADGSTSYSPLTLDYLRILGQANSGQWGTGLIGLNWRPLSTDPTQNNSVKMTLNAAAWQSGHSYPANGTVAGSNGSNFVTLNPCTSGGTQPTWNGTFPQLASGVPLGTFTPIDGNCTWYNVAGQTTVATGVVGFCAANPDTLANADSVCSALSPGDTASRFLDTNGGLHPYRDQPCVAHNQVIYGCYDYNNTGGPTNWIATPSTYYANLGVDFFHNAPPGYTPFTYPHPLQGVVSTLAPPTNLVVTPEVQAELMRLIRTLNGS